MFVRLADRLAESGMTVIRLSFRGHGKSGGTQRGMTIAGEMLDLQAAVEHTSREHPDRLSIVAASFGAVSTALSLPYLDDRLTALVLWNPVLDLRRTFLDPELPWGRENFGPEQQEILRRQGHLCVDGEFQLGRVLFEEFRTYRPDEHFANSVVPALVIHGDRDTYVSYDIAMASANARRNCDFHTVRGSDHGFDSPEREARPSELLSIGSAACTPRRHGWWEVDEEPPLIEADSVVGFGARVIGAVHVGPRSYVAAGAVVTKDVPREPVVTGVNVQTPAAEWSGQRLQGLVRHWWSC